MYVYNVRTHPGELRVNQNVSKTNSVSDISSSITHTQKPEHCGHFHTLDEMFGMFFPVISKAFLKQSKCHVNFKQDGQSMVCGPNVASHENI